MQVNSISNNQCFGARIKLSKQMKEDLLQATGATSLGSSVLSTGATSSAPVFDPAHHIHSAAKVVDGAFAVIGSGFTGVASSCFKLGSDLYKGFISKFKAKMPS